MIQHFVNREVLFMSAIGGVIYFGGHLIFNGEMRWVRTIGFFTLFVVMNGLLKWWRAARDG